jgi:hypothetical protein
MGRTSSPLLASGTTVKSAISRREGVEVDAAALKGLPHDVELSDRVLARIGGPAAASDAVNDSSPQW